jgi:S1-C subfamily serine protease
VDCTHDGQRSRTESFMDSDLIHSISPEQADTSAANPAPDGHAPVAGPPPTEIPPPPAQPPRPTAGGLDRLRRRPWGYLLALIILFFALAGSIGGGVLGAWLARGGAAAPGQGVGPSTSVTDLQQAVENVSQGVQPAVVEVESRGATHQGIGSGVILTKDGYIVTNDHVVRGFSTYTVMRSNRTLLPARLVGEDPQDDLAVLKVAASGLPTMAFADARTVNVGQFVVALGSPLGLENTATFGIVSALNRTMSELPEGPATQLVGLVQTSAPINPGNSGGALVNLQGRMIGMPTLGAAGGAGGTAIEGIGFAIPASRIQYVAAQLIEHGRLVNSGQGYLGIQGQDVTPQVAATNGLSVSRGVLVRGFANATSGSSPAQQAGVEKGDVIIAVNGQAIAGSDDLAGAILTRSPGTRVALTVSRGTQQQAIPVALGERPVSAS